MTQPGRSACDRVVRAEAVSAADLQALAEGRLLALRIPNYCSPTLCRMAARRLLARRDVAAYRNVATARRLGMVFYETMAGPEAAAAYFAAASASIRAIRDIFKPRLSPMDRLRLEIDEVWSAGAGLASMRGSKMFVGTLRVFDDGSEVEPHLDFLPGDVPDEPLCRGMTGQLAGNLYLQTSTDGGGLELWDLRLNDEEHDDYAIEGSYGLHRSKLPPSAVVLEPEAGELILFDSMNVHAVTRVAGTPRISMSCFIGYSGPDRPLVLWS